MMCLADWRVGYPCALSMLIARRTWDPEAHGAAPLAYGGVLGQPGAPSSAPRLGVTSFLRLSSWPTPFDKLYIFLRCWPLFFLVNDCSRSCFVEGDPARTRKMQYNKRPGDSRTFTRNLACVGCPIIIVALFLMKGFGPTRGVLRAKKMPQCREIRNFK